MAGRIPRVFISDLLARTDIVDLIDARVKLKKQGKNFHARAVRSITKKPPLSPSTVKNSFTTASAAGRTAMLSTS
ncbi:CHC2 zinc finger domain-containing protein [Klebsiella pneumoniae]|nr:CHC2 zinc finger domain-containing protein [Klebsiella pneumoniae]